MARAIKKIILWLQTRTPQFICGACMLICALSLISALIAQYGFNLQPCELCIMQRIPFAIIIGLSLLGIMLPASARIIIAANGLAFLTNAAIATFHSGVERKWWKGLEGCSAPDMTGSIQDLIQRIQNTSVARCDEIPWSFMGLSMANYNIVLCLGLATICILYLYRFTRSS